MRHCGLYSREMTRGELSSRMMACETGICELSLVLKRGIVLRQFGSESRESGRGGM